MEGVLIIILLATFAAARLIWWLLLTPTLRDRLRYKRLIECVKRKDIDTALEMLEKALKESPDSATCWALKAECHLLSREYHQTIFYADKALSLDVELSDAYYHKGLAYLQIGAEQEANREFDKAVWYSREQHSDALYYKGMAYLKSKQYNFAIDALQKAVALGHEGANAELLRLRNTDKGNEGKVTGNTF